MDFLYKRFTFSDCSGEVAGESVGCDASGKFKIVVQINKMPRNKHGDITSRDSEKITRKKGNERLVEVAVDVFLQGSFGNMNVGVKQQLTPQASLERLV